MDFNDAVFVFVKFGVLFVEYGRSLDEYLWEAILIVKITESACAGGVCIYIMYTWSYIMLSSNK